MTDRILLEVLFERWKENLATTGQLALKEKQQRKAFLDWDTINGMIYRGKR